MPTVIVLLADGVEEIELTTPVDLLRRAGVTVTLAAVGEGIHITGRSGLVLHADTTLTAVATVDFDCVFVPGGPGVSQLRSDPRVSLLLKAQAEADRWIAAICAAPLVLQDAGLLTGKRFTSHTSTAPELPDRLGSEKVVVDGRLLTGRGAGTALEFGLSLVEHLVSAAKAAEIAAAICV